MSVTIAIKLDGGDKLTKALVGIPSEFRSAFGKVLSKASFLIQREAKILTPVDTGRLRASIFVVNRSLQSEISTNTNYAVYVHEGTQYMTARPFMKQGAEAASSDIRSIVEDEISNSLDKMIK
jgi:HK97 gp10 family phage protein